MRRNTVLVSIVHLSLLTAACTANTQVSPRIDETKPDFEAVGVEEMVVSFDGSACQYDGPAVLTSGDVLVTRDNLTDTKIQIDIVQIAPGYSHIDFWDYIGEDGSNVHLNLLDWAPTANSSPVISNPDQKNYVFEPGSYVITCIAILESGAAAHFKGPPFWVE